MPMDMDPGMLVAQLGALGAFAFVVWYEMRLQRQERREEAAQLREILTRQSDNISALLEHVRLTSAGPVDPYGRPLSRIEQEATPRAGYRRPRTAAGDNDEGSER